MAGPETALTKKILKVLRGEGGWWVKIHGGPYQVTGIPDIIGCLGGRFYSFEVKVKETDKATPRQALQLRLIKQAGGVSRVIRGPADALKAIRKARITNNRELFPTKTWLTASQACVKIGLGLGDKPISQWKLKRLVKSGEISTRVYGGRKYYNSKSVDDFLGDLTSLKESDG